MSIAKNQPQKKVFTFAYYWRNDAEKFYLCIGRSIEEDGEKECQKCLAYDKIVDPNRGAYYQESYDDLEADLETIANDFLRFANEFNQISAAYFELESSSKSH